MDEAIKRIQDDMPDNETGIRVQQRELAIIQKAKEIM
jgi:hypothetical protein